MVKQNNVYKQAYNKALRLLEDGGNLPSEPELCTALTVSRTTVRGILAQDAGCRPDRLGQAAQAGAAPARLPPIISPTTRPTR